MSLLVFFLFSLVPFSFLRSLARRRCLSSVSSSRSTNSLPPLHLLSPPSWIWILPSKFSLHITTTSPRCPPLSPRNLFLLRSSESSVSSGESSHPQSTNLTYLSLYKTEEAWAEEEPFLLPGECCICQEEDTSNNIETPCDSNGSFRYAYQKSIQLWSNEKGNITCEICCQLYQSGYIALSSLSAASLNVLVWPSCLAILARFGHRVSSRVALHQFLENVKLHLNDIAISSLLVSPFWECSLPNLKFSKFGLPEIYSGLQSDMYFSVKERVLSSFSSRWERSIPPPSSEMERTFPPSPYSSTEEIFGVQPQILPLSVDTY